MAGKKDIAWVADQIVIVLKSDLPAQLDVLDAEYDDGVVLDDIQAQNYFISELRKPPGFPICCVIPETTNQSPFTGDQRYGIEYHSLTISVALTSNLGEEDLKRRTIRTIRGISDVLEADPLLNNTVEDTVQISKEYGELQFGEHALLQEAQLIIQVETLT